MKYLQDCKCMESEHFINDDNTPYCRWCGVDFKHDNTDNPNHLLI